MRAKTTLYHDKPSSEFAGMAYVIEEYNDELGTYAKIRIDETTIIYRFRNQFDRDNLDNNRAQVDRDCNWHDSLDDFIVYIHIADSCEHCHNLINRCP